MGLLASVVLSEFRVVLLILCTLLYYLLGMCLLCFASLFVVSFWCFFVWGLCLLCWYSLGVGLLFGLGVLFCWLIMVIVLLWWLVVCLFIGLWRFACMKFIWLDNNVGCFIDMDYVCILVIVYGLCYDGWWLIDGLNVGFVCLIVVCYFGWLFPIGCFCVILLFVVVLLRFLIKFVIVLW